MRIMNIFQKQKLALYIATRKIARFIPDRIFLKILYFGRLGKKLDFSHVKTFNEKLQWLKVYDRRTEYTMMVDKFLVRDYIAKTVGSQYLIPLLGVWDDADDINFGQLPSQYVLKCNHNSGLGMYICSDSSKVDVEEIRLSLTKGLQQNYYLTGREWPYKDVPRKIIAEKYMTDDTGIELKDYKINCFNGVPKFIQVMSGRNKDNYSVDHFDVDWQPMDIPRKDKQKSSQPISKPKQLQEMLDLAAVLSKDLPFARIDFYIAEERVYFGEITFFPVSGFVPFSNHQIDMQLGQLIQLPKS